MTDAPRTIHIISRTSRTDHDAGWEPWGVSLTGDILPWDQAQTRVQILSGNKVLADGQPYRYERRYGERARGDHWYVGHSYRLAVGYNVLASFTVGEASGFAPMMDHPVQSLDEAAAMARKLVTQNLSAYGTKVTAHIVYQNAAGYSEPLGTCDGSQFQRHEAATAILKGQWLPITWNDEAGDAPTPPASRSIPSDDGQEPTQEDDTIIRDLAQVRHVSPQWGGKPGTNAQVNGRSVPWDSRPFEEVEALVKSLGWRPMGKQGAWWNPKFDAEADTNRQAWEHKLAARYGTA